MLQYSSYSDAIYSGAHYLIESIKMLFTSSQNEDAIYGSSEAEQSRFEKYVRQIFEKITKEKFKCMYPSWLTWRGQQLELDGFNPELRIAFEVQGPQHTVFSNKYDELYESYWNRLQRDKAKVQLCEENGIDLVVIDYKIPKKRLKQYIKSRLGDIKLRIKCYPWHTYASDHKKYMKVLDHKPYHNAEFEKDLI